MQMSPKSRGAPNRSTIGISHLKWLDTSLFDLLITNTGNFCSVLKGFGHGFNGFNTSVPVVNPGICPGKIGPANAPAPNPPDFYK